MILDTPEESPLVKLGASGERYIELVESASDNGTKLHHGKWLARTVTRTYGLQLAS